MAIKLRGGKVLIPFLLLVLILFFFIYPTGVLEITDSSSRTLALFPLGEFSVIYTHSVEKTDVRENYRIQAGEIILTDTWFYSYGAGLPATTEYDFEITPQGFHIYNINKGFEEVIYRTGKKIAEHRLLVGSREIYFSHFSHPGQAVNFHVGRQPRWKLYIGGSYFGQ